MSKLIVIGLIVVGLFSAIVIYVRLRRRRENQDPHGRADRLRREAQRFSGRLMSEIKLNNEVLVADGRQSNDLYHHLREELERARKLYEKHVDWPAADRDYFHEALVEILCDGDAEVLGSEYPGPRGYTLQ
jgi:hypothetical protein